MAGIGRTEASLRRLFGGAGVVKMPGSRESQLLHCMGIRGMVEVNQFRRLTVILERGESQLGVVSQWHCLLVSHFGCNRGRVVQLERDGGRGGEKEREGEGERGERIIN